MLNISLSSKNETNVSFVPKLGPNFNFKMENTSGLLNLSYLRISIVYPFNYWKLYLMNLINKGWKERENLLGKSFYHSGGNLRSEFDHLNFFEAENIILYLTLDLTQYMGEHVRCSQEKAKYLVNTCIIWCQLKNVILLLS